MKLIPVKDRAKLDAAGIFYTPKTLYQYHHIQKWPKGIFVSQGGKLLIDVEKFRTIIQQVA